MKYLIFSDIHLHSWESFGIDIVTGMPRRLLDQERVLDQILSLCESESIDCVLFCGDMFQIGSEVPVEALNTANSFFKALRLRGIEYILVSGNHDLSKLKDTKRFHSALTHLSDQANEVVTSDKIYVINYYDEVDYDKIKGYDIVLAHKTPIGSCQNGHIFEDGVNWKELASNNRFVFFGHIHEAQELSINCVVVGSPMHLNFGDGGDRGCWVLEPQKESLVFHSLVSPKFLNVYNAAEIKNDGNYYKFRGDLDTDDPNVVVVKRPNVFEDKIQSDDFVGVLKEWLILHDRSLSDFEHISDIVLSKIKSFRTIRNVRLSRVEITDFLSIEDVSYDVSNGFIFIDGRSDQFSSNGSGKTSVVGEALVYLLFGSTTKGLSGDDVIRNRPTQQKDCLVKAMLTQEDKVISVSRSRKNGLSLVVDGIDIVSGFRESDKQIQLEAFLGFDKMLFLSACYFSQENLTMFTGISDSEKTNMVSSLLGFEVFDEISSEILNKINDLDVVERQKAQDNKRSIEVSVLRLQDSLSARKEELESLLSSHRNVIRSIKDVEDLILSELAKQPPVRTYDKDSILNKIKELDSLEKVRFSEMEKITEKNKSLMEKRFELQEKKNQVEKVLGVSDFKIRTINQEIDNLKESSLVSHCDKCGAVLDRSKYPKMIESKKKELDSLFLSQSDDARVLENMSIKIDAVTEASSELNNKIVHLGQETKEIRLNKSHLETELQNAEVEDKGIADFEFSRNVVTAQLRAKLELIREDEDRISTSQNSVENKILDIGREVASKKDDLKEVDVTIKKIEKDVEVYQFWRNALSSKGVSSLLLTKFCNVFNVYVNEYLATISAGSMSLSITPTKQLKSGDQRNKIGLEIYMKNKMCKYESLSGGEKRRVDVALCFSLNKYISEKYLLCGGILGIIILDEIASFLDRSAEESIANVLIDEGKTKAVFVISHTPELGVFADKKMLIVKENDISRLE